ncbi:c-type cytochrome domain-containing protein [Gemmata sp. JC717]|uniref:c-type cytochrome domain-containing protein n=1 Tax=Gemmata algarum TaxID=2975278 RepID=UPI0021BA6523|nr:c-type cytochrome domain-containing protein [Gemmata algarum]MDY3554648.1 c-type cytochrome domain-containing protein [Gemmata algarum]
MRHLTLLCGLVALLGGGSRVLADAKNPTFDDDVLPIVKQHCVNCHSNDKQKGDLNLATYAALQKGGSSGAAVKAGDPGKSRIYTLSAHIEEPKMPPNGNKMPDAQLATLKLWVEQGARENSGSKVAAAPKASTEIGLKSLVKGRPEGPPPMPALGKLKLEPVLTARRPGSILALAASPWAPVVAIGGQKQVILYNTDTGALVGFIPFEHGQINSIKFSRNAQLLLVAGGKGGQSGKAVLYKVETGEKVIEVGIESDAILSADISADQTQIAVGSPSKLVRIYSTADGKVVREIKKHTDWVTAVEYSPDGVLLATGDRNGGAFVWEAFTGREYFALRGHTAAVTDIAWRDDSNVLATGSEDTTIKLWEMENGGNIKSWGAHGGGTASVRFTHDGKLASTGRDKVTKLWDQNGTALKSFEAFPDLGLKVAVTHDNARVIAGDWGGVVKAWSAADAKAVAVLDANPLPAAERLKRAEATLAAAATKLQVVQAAFDAAALKAKQATDAHTAAVANANKISADLAAAQKAVTDFTAAANAAKPLADAAKAEVDKAAPAVAPAANKVAALEATVTAEAAAAKALADAAAKAPGNPDLAAQSKKKADAVAALSAELAAAKKAHTDAAAALKTAQEKLAAQSKAHADATAQIAAHQQKVAALTPTVKPAADAVPPAKAAMDAANAAVAPAKAALDAVNAEVAGAKATIEQLKGTAPKK